jgi:hypothetical protein
MPLMDSFHLTGCFLCQTWHFPAIHEERRSRPFFIGLASPDFVIGPQENGTVPESGEARTTEEASRLLCLLVG